MTPQHPLTLSMCMHGPQDLGQSSTAPDDRTATQRASSTAGGWFMSPATSPKAAVSLSPLPPRTAHTPPLALDDVVEDFPTPQRSPSPLDSALTPPRRLPPIVMPVGPRARRSSKVRTIRAHCAHLAESTSADPGSQLAVVLPRSALSPSPLLKVTRARTTHAIPSVAHNQRWACRAICLPRAVRVQASVE